MIRYIHIYTLMLQHYNLRWDKIKEGIYFNFSVAASPPTIELLNVIEEQPDSWRHSSTGLGADGVAGRRRTREPDPENTEKVGPLLFKGASYFHHLFHHRYEADH